MTNQETLELALNALKCLFGLPDKFTGEGGDVAVWRLGGLYRAQEAIKALEDALAKQEQGEPHSWYSAQEDEWMTEKTRKDHERLNSYTHKVGGFDLPLYTTPQQPSTLVRTWVGLTDDQKPELIGSYFAEDWAQKAAEGLLHDYEAKLKEKNT